jgi:hypothetical protein
MDLYFVTYRAKEGTQFVYRPDTPTHEPVEPLILFDTSADDLHTNHRGKLCKHTGEKVQLRPGLVHQG